MFNLLDPKKLITCGLLVILALVSFFPAANTLSSPDFHRERIEELDQKKLKVVELTAATAIGSTVVAAIPGDMTTPIANQIAELSSYLLLITGAIMLEKFLLTLTGLVAFRYLIPLACGLLILWRLLGREGLRRLALRLILFSLAISLVIPVSLRVSTLFDETFHSQEAIEETIQGLEEPEEKQKTGFLAGITDSASQLKEKAEQALSNTIDAIAILLISNCAIPVLTLLVMLWLTKAIFGLPLPDRDSLRKKLASAKSTEAQT